MFRRQKYPRYQAILDALLILIFIAVGGAQADTLNEANAGELLLREAVAGEHYGLLMVLPPLGAVVPSLPRELIFVIDTSGSMGGTSILQARASLQFAPGQ